MFLMIAGILIGAWVLFMGWKFYGTIDWSEPADPSPDLQAMHKREAQLMHIQEVLEEACAEGKLSQAVIDEFNRYCDSEIKDMQSVETAWKNRRKSKSPSV